MLEGLLQNNSLPLLEKVVDFTQTRHGLLAGNIANMDTPGYRGRDLDTVGFAEQLKEFAAAQRTGDISSQASGFADLRKPGADTADMSWANLTRHDEADIGLEQQISRISKNQMEHNLAMTLMTSQFRLLQAAISEKP
ncbi:MAG: flagellar basal body rod protein FlgB [Pirellulales bacterium]